MENIDFINVAGLLMDGKNDSLENALRVKLHPHSITTIAPTPLHAARENPNRSIERAISMVKQAIERVQTANPTASVVLMGRSYGGFIALLAACRMNFGNISKIITIESHVNPDIDVVPPRLLPPLALCGPHYEHRASLAQEAVDFLNRHGTRHVVTIQAGDEDGVVPIAAQAIPGDFQIFMMEDDNIEILASNPHSKGIQIHLLPHLGSDDSGFKMALPQSYRNHLFWSREKMQCVTGSIEAVVSMHDHSYL